MKNLLFVLLVILFLNCANNDKAMKSFDINHKFNLKELREDYVIFRSALEEAHPGIYRYTAKKKFDAFFDSIQLDIKSEMTEIEFFRLISPLIANIRCGHTGISPSQNYWNYMKKTDTYFPLQLKFISDKAYVLKSYDMKEIIPPGSEIISINQKSVSEITSKLFKIISSDGNIKTAKYRSLDEDFAKLFFLYIGPQDSFNIEYISSRNNLLNNKILPAKSWKDIIKHKTSYRQGQNEPLRFKIIESSNVAIMTIVTFIPRIIENNYGNFISFIDSTFTLLNEKNIPNLIIDVRGNNGGDEHYLSHILSKFIDQSYCIYEKIDVPTPRYSFLKYTQQGFLFNLFNSLAYVRNKKTGRYDLKGKAAWHQLIKPTEPHFQGKIYFLIDGWSFSGASDFCALAHYYARNKITFIGEETGGAYYGNNSGDWLQLTLPNTQIQVSIPMRYYLLSVFDYPYSDRGIIPDFEVIPTMEDILSSKDTQLEFALNLIKQE